MSSIWGLVFVGVRRPKDSRCEHRASSEVFQQRRTGVANSGRGYRRGYKLYRLFPIVLIQEGWRSSFERFHRFLKAFCFLGFALPRATRDRVGNAQWQWGCMNGKLGIEPVTLAHLHSMTSADFRCLDPVSRARHDPTVMSIFWFSSRQPTYPGCSASRPWRSSSRN